MNRVITAFCPLIPFFKWGRANGIPAVLLLTVNEYIDEHHGLYYGSRMMITRYRETAPTPFLYRFLVRDRDLDLVTLYLGSVTVLR